MASENWLKCKASKGQFQNELAVQAVDHQGEIFSFFVDRDLVAGLSGDAQVEEVDAKLRVTLLDSSSGLALILLPGQTFGNGSTITVKQEALSSEDCMLCEPA